jgi:uncharacterized protein YdeI (YjbR/CyaY-like superfamily)
MDWRVEDYINKLQQWQQEHKLAREICLNCGLIEDFKWGQPCYTFEGKNVVIFAAQKDYFALGFFKGVLFENESNLLIQPTENMQAGRQIRFTEFEEMKANIEAIEKVIHKAIEIEKAGKKVAFKDTEHFQVPTELTQRFAEDEAYKKAFEALTPGRQRGYLLYFGGAKQSSTRSKRIDKLRDKVFEGKGYNER